MTRNHALIIGVNQYPMLDPSRTLTGCVSDAQLMCSVLQTGFGFKADEIVELYDAQANQRNILAAMDKLVEEAQPGDCVFFHFAGHGSQRTCLDGSEGSGMDSTIMPADSGREDHPNLDIADDDIGIWLEKLTTKTDNITLIFDCCHSGTITRDPWAATARGVPADLRSLEEMGLTQRPRKIATRDLSGGSFLPRSDAYVVISGCRDDESSHEYTLDKDGVQLRHGALTFWLTQSMQAAKPGSTYQDIFELTSNRITSLFPTQHPQIEGRRDRILLGTERVESLKYLNLKTSTGMRATINGGAAHGVMVGSHWAVFPPGTNSTDGLTPLANLTVTEVEAMNAYATVEPANAELAPTCRCILVSAPLSMPALSIDTSPLPLEARAELDTMLKNSSLLQVANTPATADLRITAVGSKWTALSKDERALLPAQDLQQQSDYDRMLDNLETRARARNVFALANPESELQVDFNLYRSTDGSEWTPVNENTVFNHGDRIAFELVNREDRDVYLSVLDIGLSGRVSLFYPPGNNSELIQAGRTLKVGFTRIKIHLGMPDDYDQPIGRETFKAMVSTDETSFAWMQQSGTRAIGISSLLQKMMQHAYKGVTTRDPVVSWAEPGDDWQGINRSFELQHIKENIHGS